MRKKHSKNTARVAGVSTLLDEVLATIHTPRISLSQLLAKSSTAGIGLLLVLIAAPAALPIPAVGYGTILAIPLLLISLQMVLGRQSLWLPPKFTRKEISRDTLSKTQQRLKPWLQRYERLSNARLLWLSNALGMRVVGACCLIAACFVALPFPLTNTVPSMGIVLMGLGLLERDGLAILSGMLVSALGIALAIAAYMLGIELLKSLIGL